MNGRKCGTCKHFEPAPIWRKGWCRNPLLFSPQQSHLVAEDELDCERGMGNYWESDHEEADDPDKAPLGMAHNDKAYIPLNRPRTPSMRTDSGKPVYSVSGSSGMGGDPPPPSSPSEGGPLWSGDDNDLDYLNGERYWTDWVRIIAPIIGVIIIVFLLYLWISNFLDDGDNEGVASGTTTPLPTLVSSATPSITTSPAVGTPSVVPSGSIVIGTPGEATPTTGDSEPGEIVEGAEVVVANTGGTGVNIRDEASTSAGIVTVALDGTVMTIISGAVESEGFIWWPVENADFTGWVVEDYIELAQ